jgi:negative regulator of sigma E activity
MTDLDHGYSMKLSHAIDDEVSAEELDGILSKLSNDDELLHQWSRYSLIGHVIRNGHSTGTAPDLWLRVRDQVQAEPTILAPRAKPVQAQTNWSQHFVGYALAASLLALTITVGKSFLENSSRVFSPQVATANAVDPNTPTAYADSRFDEYLLVHNESAQLAGTGGVLHYARLVSAKNTDF